MKLWNESGSSENLSIKLIVRESIKASSVSKNDHHKGNSWHIWLLDSLRHIPLRGMVQMVVNVNP